MQAGTDLPLIELSPDELYAAAAVAVHRRISSMRFRSKGQHYQCPDATEWSTEIESACAELAFARFMDRYWSGAVWDGRAAPSDVGPYQVRHTAYPDGHLIVYDEDADAAPMVLMIGRDGAYRVAGGLRAGACKLPKYRRENARTASWWVPQADLKPFPRRT